jgi:aldose 1-epimerase
LIKISNPDGTLTAEIDPVGAALSKVTFNNQQLVGSPDEFSGVILFPWPNRIFEGNYTFRHISHNLIVNHLETNSALHGLVFDKTFDAKRINSEKLELYFSNSELNGYPFSFQLAISYQVLGNELICRAMVTNLDSQAIPFAVGFHPYFLVTDTARFESNQKPISSESCPEGLVQIGSGVQSKLCDLEIDQTLNGSVKPISKIFDQNWTVEIHQSNLPYTHVFTNRYSQVSKLWFAIEPQSAPANSLQSGDDLTVLAAGQQASFEYRIILTQP